MKTRLGVLRNIKGPLYFCFVESHDFVWPVREFNPPGDPRTRDLLHLPCFEYTAVVKDPCGKKDLLRILFSREKCDMILSLVEEPELDGAAQTVCYQKIFGVDPFETVIQVTGEGHYCFSVRAFYTFVTHVRKITDEPYIIRGLPPEVILDPDAMVGIQSDRRDSVDGVVFPSYDENAPECEENPGKPFRMGDD